MNFVNIDNSIILITIICNDSKIQLKGNNNMQVAGDSSNLGEKCMKSFQHLEGDNNCCKSNL
jgi:hypothetical protein